MKVTDVMLLPGMPSGLHVPGTVTVWVLVETTLTCPTSEIVTMLPRGSPTSPLMNTHAGPCSNVFATTVVLPLAVPPVLRAARQLNTKAVPARASLLALSSALQTLM